MVYILISALILGVDIFTKILAKTHLKDGTIPLIKDVFHFTYVENRGAAFGILQNAWVFFIAVAIVLAVVVVWLLKQYKVRPRMMSIGLSFLCAGALGNTIDRIMQGFVVDFFDFRLIDFPVFNVADIFVCCGAGLLAVFFIFFDKSETEDKDVTSETKDDDETENTEDSDEIQNAEDADEV